MNNDPSLGQLAITDLRANDLWEQLRLFSFDRGGGPRTFAARLAREQGWDEAFTALAIAEYRRFLLLSALADLPTPADAASTKPAVRIVPSPAVDKVWHLHLLYTQSYWEDLCRNILGGPLHHFPAEGASGEAPALDAVYRETLTAYRRTFGHAAPVRFWPSANPAPVRAVDRPLEGPPLFALIFGVIGILFFVGILAAEKIVPVVLFPLALAGAFFAMVKIIKQSAGGPHHPRRRHAGDGGGGWDGSTVSAFSDSGSDNSHAHHDGGSHGGGSHDAGGHSSHSCGGGHSCGGHGCGGGSCGGGH